VEINAGLAARLDATGRAVVCGDFLSWDGRDFGAFDRVVMNPPFDNGADIRHVQHAFTMLAPGGRLVAIVANGPRENAQLRPRAVTWEELPPGTFAGTNVRAAIMVWERA
jgi:type I restriction-modification system DNA methylase subunit